MLGSGLYAILDLGVLLGRDPLAAAEALLLGGAVALQLRAKHASRSALEPLARKLRDRCRQAAVPFVINDDVTLAVLVDADAVHLGQQDDGIASARRRLAPGQRIGRSTHSLAQALRAVEESVDYLGFGPVFATRTKDRADPPVGLAALHEVCLRVPLPVVAIGGLNVGCAADVARAGARAAAAIDGLLRAPDLALAARQFGEAFSEGLTRPSGEG
jgi:thiamine-phosphate pyrophosphorylase